MEQFRKDRASLNRMRISPELRIILSRTLDFKDTIRLVKAYAFQGNPKLGGCTSCSGRPITQHCVQEIMVTPQLIPEAVIGCGVSLAPVDIQMKPLPVSHPFRLSFL